MYQVNHNHTIICTGTLHDCLHHIGQQIALNSDWRSVTVAQAIAAGYSLTKV